MKKLIVVTLISILSVYVVMQLSGSSRAAENTHWDGPILENDQRAEMQKDLSGKLTFVDSKGRHFLLGRDIRDVIDAYLQKIPQIGSHIPPRGPNGTFLTGFGRENMSPYIMHILTISPIVILAVPKAESDYYYCSGQFLRTGIIMSGSLALDCYSYLVKPRIMNGSFWFFPDIATGPIFLPEGKETYTIDLKDSRLVLTANGDKWDVHRYIVAACATSPTGCIQPLPPVNTRYVISADGTEVSDLKNKLIWRRCVEGMALSEGVCVGSAGNYTFEQAKDQAKIISDKTNKPWRVPTVDELSAIGMHTDLNSAFPDKLENVSCLASGGDIGALYKSSLHNCTHADYTMGGGRGAVRLVRSGL